MAEPQEQSNREPPYTLPPNQKRSVVITALITAFATALVTGFMPYIFGLFRGDIKTQIVNEINQTLAPLNRDIGDIKTKLAVLETKVDNLDRQVFRQFRAKATALGIANPQISLINLKEKEAKHIIQYFVKDLQGNDLGLITATLRVLAVEKDAVLMALDQRIFDYTTMKEVPPGTLMEFRVPLQTTPPVLLKIRLKIGNQEATPVVLKLAVIDRPSPDLLVLATGTPSSA